MGVRKEERECDKHGITIHHYRDKLWRCGKCRGQAVADWRRNAKIRLLSICGNCCIVCGYNRCGAALEFHHLDPSLKEFSFSSGVPINFQRLVDEARKCVLCCSNCHREIETGIIELDNDAVQKYQVAFEQRLAEDSYYTEYKKGKCTPSCSDCGAQISYGAVRCLKCHRSYRKPNRKPSTTSASG